MTHDVKKIASLIGQFYLNKNNYDYKLTRKQLLDLFIQDIQLINLPFKKIIIHTSRPGLLIGKRGENLRALEVYFNCTIEIKEQENILLWLIPEEPYDLLDV